MFSTGILWVTIFAVTMSLAFVVGLIYFVNKIFVANMQDVLVKFILLVFTGLVGVYIIDKIVAFRVPLLTDTQDTALFDLIKTLTLMIFSYYFGTKQNNNESDRQEHSNP